MCWKRNPENFICFMWLFSFVVLCFQVHYLFYVVYFLFLINLFFSWLYFNFISCSFLIAIDSDVMGCIIYYVHGGISRLYVMVLYQMDIAPDSILDGGIITDTVLCWWYSSWWWEVIFPDWYSSWWCYYFQMDILMILFFNIT